MLKLRRATVVGQEPLIVEAGGERRPAWADEGLVGPVEAGDEVIINTEALDLDLGSGGFDVVHANLTRGLRADGADGPHVMKLNYTSLQHPVDPVEVAEGAARQAQPVHSVVLPLHGHLAPVAWAIRRALPEAVVGYIQTAGGGLPGSLSRDVAKLLESGHLDGHVTASPCFGGAAEAISVCGALDAAGQRLGWDIALVGPGPGILGSGTTFGHGGMSALANAHESLALNCPTVLSLRMSSSDPRPRHRGLSHHSATVLAHLLAGVEVAVPAGEEQILADVERIASEAGAGQGHRTRSAPADIDGYASSGLPRRTMGRDLEEDRLFFAAPLAAGALAAELCSVA